MSLLKGRKLENWLGLLGAASFVIYLIAVFITPHAYPGYRWMSQAISDLNAKDAPSRELWSLFATVSSPCGLVSATVACLYVRNRLNRKLRAGIYLFTVLSWISTIGYVVFPLTESGYAGAFQDIMHVFVLTPIVFLLSVLSYVLMMVGGYGNRPFRSVAILSTVLLSCMIIGTVGLVIGPRQYGGLMERLSVFPGIGFSFVLGIYLFIGFDLMERHLPEGSSVSSVIQRNRESL